MQEIAEASRIRISTTDTVGFEEFPKRSDIQITKPLMTSGGNMVRATISPAGVAMFSLVGKPDSKVTTIVWNPPNDVTTSEKGAGGGWIGVVLDFIDRFLGDGGGNSGGGSGECVTQTQTITTKSGIKIETTTRVCPA